MLPEPVRAAVAAAEQTLCRLRAILLSVGLPEPRVRDLTAKLGIDKSTASRVCRGLRAPDGAAALRELPAAEGLLAIVRACEAHSVSDDLVAPARAAVGALDQCVRVLPGGRAGLVTALMGVDEACSDAIAHGGPRMRGSRRERERTARRTAMESLCFLQGVRLDAAVHVLVLRPSQKPGCFDQALLSALVGLRRLRPGPPIMLGGVYRATGEAAPTRTTLRGVPLGHEPREALLPELCDGPIERLRVEHQGNAYLYWLDRADPPLDEPATLAYGIDIKDFYERVRSERFRFANTSFMVRRPTGLFLLDVLLPPGMFPKPPDLRITMDIHRVPDPLHGPREDGGELLEQHANFVHMGRGFADIRGKHATQHARFARAAMETLRLDPMEFERYQVEIEYPIAFLGVNVWLELADPHKAP